MFAHVSPESDSFGETVSTLKFAQRASTVELGTARLNKESREVMDLKEQIESLKKQLADKEPQSAQHVNKLEPRSPLPRPKAAAATMDRTPKSPRSPLPRPKATAATMDRTPKSPRSPLPQPKAAVATMDRTPKSPTAPNSASKSRQVKPLVLPKTPESHVSIRNEIIISSEIRASTAANVKSSHIRKSLRTIGKLINGSEKRIQTKTNEAQTSTLTPPVIARPSRRQSLTGVQPPERSRRSSLGGVDPCVNGNTNARTPPTVSRSSKSKWM
ncbi:hypothetical protein M8C21_025902 [Ambrosia artemisiifolia]|uniref:Kinesin motor domain-containing protein n=1 Tax=Ambrosia artemisiifolia TaxID=4212 RepID=A0AAD5CVY4_AMBAR|nr:hypothetical protein M8C21_025902 [Ambrosia artemisiifolia]